jgi:hypothetical protein
VTINQNERRVALFFGTFATSYTGMGVWEGRLEAPCFTDSAFLRLRRRVPLLLRGGVIPSPREVGKVCSNNRPRVSTIVGIRLIFSSSTRGYCRVVRVVLAPVRVEQRLY